MTRNEPYLYPVYSRDGTNQLTGSNQTKYWKLTFCWYSSDLIYAGAISHLQKLCLVLNNHGRFGLNDQPANNINQILMKYLMREKITQCTKNSWGVFWSQQVLILTERALNSHGPWEYRPSCMPVILNMVNTLPLSFTNINSTSVIDYKNWRKSLLQDSSRKNPQMVPLKAMSFIDWNMDLLHYASTQPTTPPNPQKYFPGWYNYYNVDWSALSRLITEQL